MSTEEKNDNEPVLEKYHTDCIETEAALVVQERGPSLITHTDCEPEAGCKHRGLLTVVTFLSDDDDLYALPDMGLDNITGSSLAKQDHTDYCRHLCCEERHLAEHMACRDINRHTTLCYQNGCQVPEHNRSHIV